MLNDVFFITQKVFDEALEKRENLNAPKKVYDVYRNLCEVIKAVELVANHYLVFDFTASQNDCSEEAKDEWRKILNKDLEHLNISIKKYLTRLACLTHSNCENDTYVYKIYEAKAYNYFVKNDYNIGFVESKGKSLHIDQLKIDLGDMDSFCIGDDKKVDLSTFEARKNLQKLLNEINDDLKIEFIKLREYIKKRYTLEEFL